MGKLNMDAMKAKLESASKSNYSDTEYDKLQDGKNIRRILWPKGDKEEFWSEGYVHFGLGPEGKSIATCAKTFGKDKKCPICEEVERLKATGDKEDKKLADSIRQTKRIYINVINRDDEEEPIKVLSIGVTILKGLLEAICDPDYGDITDFEDGRDMTIKKSGKGLNTEYSVLPKPKASVASEELSAKEIEEKMTDLDSLFIEKSYDELLAVLNGEEPDDDDDDEDEDEDTEDEDEAEDYDDMDVDELSALCKKRHIKLPAKVTKLKLIALLSAADEDDDEDEEDADDEDETADDSDDDDSDDLQNEIAAALKNRKKK